MFPVLSLFSTAQTGSAERRRTRTLPGQVDGGIPPTGRRRQGSQDPRVHGAADGLPAQKLCVQVSLDAHMHTLGESSISSLSLQIFQLRLLPSQDSAVQWICEKGVWEKALWLLPVWGIIITKRHGVHTLTASCIFSDTNSVVFCQEWELLSPITGRGCTKGIRQSSKVVHFHLFCHCINKRAESPNQHRISLTGTCWSDKTVPRFSRRLSPPTVLCGRPVFLQRFPHQLLRSAAVDALRRG